MKEFSACSSTRDRAIVGPNLECVSFLYKFCHKAAHILFSPTFIICIECINLLLFFPVKINFLIKVTSFYMNLNKSQAILDFKQYIIESRCISKYQIYITIF